MIINSIIISKFLEKDTMLVMNLEESPITPILLFNLRWLILNKVQ